jgi:vesicular inhibitory amino acid transporter
VQRIFLTGTIVVVSIVIPDFSSMMAILGSFSAFMLAIVGPIIAKIMIGRSCTIFDGVAISMGIVMAVWGTLATFV